MLHIGSGSKGQAWRKDNGSSANRVSIREGSIYVCVLAIYSSIHLVEWKYIKAIYLTIIWDILHPLLIDFKCDFSHKNLTSIKVRFLALTYMLFLEWFHFPTLITGVGTCCVLPCIVSLRGFTSLATYEGHVRWKSHVT